MKKFTTMLCLALLLPATTLWAKPVSPEEALNTVEQIFSSNRKQLSLKPSANNRITPAKEYKNGTEPFYAFNRGKGEGFVLLSGDDELPAIVGYADSGAFSYENMPDALRAYLDEYAAYVTAVQAGEMVHSAPDTYSPPQAIAPLLTMKWDQNEPYNRLCPTFWGDNHMPTGCVATAMAQVMKYYNYPAQGRGSHTYNRVDGEVTVDFSQSHYEWDKMLDTYVKGKYNDEQANAVALLMRDLGVAVEMNYSSGASGAYTSSVVPAMIKYFGYSDKSVQIHRNYISTHQYMELIYTELAASRPVLYAAAAINGGSHEFICDGMDSNGMLHINWGWGGSSDGYFNLSYMEPSSQGTGGSGGTSGYIKDASIIINLQPADEVTAPTDPITITHLTHRKDVTYKISGRKISATAASVWNSNSVDFDGEIGVAIEIEGNQRILSQKELALDAWDYAMSRHNFTLPDDITDGTYPIYFITRSNEYEPDRWDKIQAPHDIIGNAEMAIAVEEITINTEEKNVDLYLSRSIYTENEVLAVGYSNKIIVPVYNKGTVVFDGSIGVKLYDIETNTLKYSTAQYQTLIYDESSFCIEFPVKFDQSMAGEYYVDAVLENGTVIPYEGERSILKIKSSEELPDVYLSEPISVAINPLVQGSDNNTITLPLRLSRSGKYSFRINATNPSGESQEIATLINRSLREGGNFRLNIDLQIDNLAIGEYILSAEWLNSEGLYEALMPETYSNISVTIKDDAGIQPDCQETFIARWESSTLLLSQVEVGSTIQVIDLAGRLLYTGTATDGKVAIPLDTKRGIYFVTIVSDNGAKTIKVMKN